MRLNTKMRYGTRAMLELACHYPEGLRSLAEIAASQEVSPKYMESVFRLLRSAGLVHAQRGGQGGYRLSRPPEAINLRDLYEILEGPEPYVACTEDAQICPRSAECVTQEVWARMYAAAVGVLAGTTLADLVRRGQERHEQPAYSI